MPGLGVALGLPFSQAAMLGGWTPASVTSPNLLQWLHDIDVAGSPWLKDKSQTGDDRILSGGPGLQQGRCVELNGTNQYVDTGQDPVFGSAVSVFGWIKTTATSGALASHYNGANRSWLINVHTSGHVRVLLSDDGTFPGASGKNYESTESVNDGNWHHIGFTFSDSTLKLYIDGAEISPTKSVDNSMSTLYNPPDNVLIGAMNAGAAQLLNGSLFGVTVFSDGLTADEVSWLYSHGASGTDPSMTNCLGYYKLDEQSGSTAYDSSGNGNNGTYTNSPTHSTQDVYSWQNSVGYSLSGAVFVPRDESDPANDVTGSTLDYTGSAPRHARLTKSNCVELNGTNQTLEKASASLSVSTHGSLSIWVKTTDTVAVPLSISGGSNTNELALYVGLVTPGKVSCLCHASTGNYSYRESGTAINDGAWHNIVAVMDGGSDVANLKIYVDGISETGTTGTAGTPADLSEVSRTVVVGGRSTTGATEYLAGKVCGARVYSDALTAAEVAGIYKFTSADPGASSCEGEWPLAEGSGTTSYDVTANNLDLTHYNTPTWSTDNNVLAWNVGFGFRESGGVKIPGLRAGGTAADGNAFTNAAVDGHNGAEAHINFNPYTIPALASGNTDGYTVPTDWDVFEDDLKTPSQHWCLREDQDNDFSEFFLYDDELTGDDWDNAHAYVDSVAQINALLEHLWTMDALTGSAPQSTEDEINSLSLDGGSMDAESTVTPAQRGNAIEIIDTGGSGDATLTATAPANLNLNKPVTFFGWFKLVTAPSGTDCMLADQNAASFRLEVNHTTNYLEWTYNGQTITDNVALNDSAFHFFTCARDEDGNLTLWVDGRWVGKQVGVSMPNATGTLAFGADGDMGGATVHYDEVGATDTNKLRDNHVGFLAAGKYLNKTSNEFEA